MHTWYLHNVPLGQSLVLPQLVGPSLPESIRIEPPVPASVPPVPASVPPLPPPAGVLPPSLALQLAKIPIAKKMEKYCALICVAG